jgi:hypothetical protein
MAKKDQATPHVRQENRKARRQRWAKERAAERALWTRVEVLAHAQKMRMQFRSAKGMPSMADGCVLVAP